jgi:hypothetical protein
MYCTIRKIHSKHQHIYYSQKQFKLNPLSPKLICHSIANRQPNSKGGKHQTHTMIDLIYYSPFLLMASMFVQNDVFAFQNPHPSAVGLLARGTSAWNRPFAATTTTFRQPFHHQPWTSKLSPPSPSSSQQSTTTALFGIPKMFRWLTDQYPNILNRRLGSASSIPPIDNFYLDMNGIIHPCTHGNNEDEITILDETEMFKKIFGYVDRLYKIVQPKKVLYLAVDGVSTNLANNGSLFHYCVLTSILFSACFTHSGGTPC